MYRGIYARKGFVISLGDFSSCFCLTLSPQSFRDATNAEQYNSYIGNMEINSWIMMFFMVVLVGNCLSSWQEKGVCCNFPWTYWVCLIWLVCTFALSLVLLETLDLLPVWIRCAYSFFFVCGAQEGVVRHSLLWLPSFQTSPEIWSGSSIEWAIFFDFRKQCLE